jgi:uncharacterized protein
VIDQQLLDTLRCPWDPKRESRLVPQDDSLVCERCRLRYKIKDGFPVLVVEEAELPPEYESLEQLPCHQEGRPEPGLA